MEVSDLCKPQTFSKHPTKVTNNISRFHVSCLQDLDLLSANDSGPSSEDPPHERD